jgi:HK97 family phage major capsid protein
MDFLSQLRDKLARLISEREAAKGALDAVLEVPAAEARDLTEDEQAVFTEARDKVKSLDTDIEAVEARVAELEAIEARNRKAAEVRPSYDGVARVGDETRTYNPDTDRTGDQFMRDVLNQRADFAANERLSRHMAEERIERNGGVESRAFGTSAVAGLVVPQYLTDMVAPAARAMRPTADIATKHSLPADGMTVNISRITTGTSAAAQASENAAVSETNLDDTLLTINVRTIAGQQTVSRQALDRGTGVGEVVLSDLVRAYHTNLDNQILNSDGTSGTHLGIRSTGSIVAVTYTDASPTAAEAYPKLFDLIQQVQSGVYMGLSHFVMHPRRWWWFASQVGTSFPFITPVNAGVQQGGSVATREYGGISGYIAGVPVVVDGNIPTNLGGGTEDVILGVTAEELHLWEEAGSPLYIRADQTNAASLGELLVVFGYSAFSAGRYPGAHGTITGTGVAAPTFA